MPLGVWNSSFRIPPPLDAAEAKAKEKKNSTQRRHTPIEEKKTFCWLEGYRLSCQLAEANPGVKVISVADREGDIIEVPAERQQRLAAGQPAADWLVRCQHTDRILEAQELNLKERVQSRPVLGIVSFEMSAQPENKKEKRPKRQARTVVQELRACTVELKPPRGKESLGPVTVSVVFAQEIHTPEGQTPICWLLLTSLEATTLDQAIQVIDYYLLRWEIEVFHKILIHTLSGLQCVDAAATFSSFSEIIVFRPVPALPSGPENSRRAQRCLRPTIIPPDRGLLRLHSVPCVLPPP